jgi:hypothetical protein
MGPPAPLEAVWQYGELVTVLSAPLVTEGPNKGKRRCMIRFSDGSKRHCWDEQLFPVVPDGMSLIEARCLLTWGMEALP